jgi:hypothetical protein
LSQMASQEDVHEALLFRTLGIGVRPFLAVLCIANDE